MTMTPALPTPASRPPPAFMPWYVKPGDRIGEYTICTGLGEGSGGVVYDVKNAAGAHFALKLSRHPIAPTGRPSIPSDRFQLSAMAHLALNDVPNVAKLIGFNTLQTPQGAFLYLVMELVPGGETITAWAQRTSPSLAKLVSVFIDIATALGTLADMKICHRDLKPQNILIAPGDVPKIVDLNSVAFPVQKTITYPAASAIPGTPAYFSPELAAAVLAEMRTRLQEPYAYAPTDDLYALGCVFYEVLTGELPCCDIYEQEEVMLQQIVGKDPVRPHELSSSIPWPISKVVLKLLRKDPRERYQSGHELADDLKAAYHNTADKNWQVPFVVRPGDVDPTRPLWLVPPTPIAPADLSTQKGPPASTAVPAVPSPKPRGPSTCHILSFEAPGLPEASGEPVPAPAQGQAEAAEESQAVAPAPEVAKALAEAPSEPDSSAAPTVTTAAVEAQPPPTKRLRRRWAVRRAAPVALIVIAGLVAWLYLGQHCPPDLSVEKGPRVLCKAKLAVVAAASTALSCVGLMGNVRAQDEEYLANCSAEERETVRALGIEPYALTVFDDGPYVKTHRFGYEMKEGPIEVEATNAGLPDGSTLLGKIRIGSDGASVRFSMLRLRAGRREVPVCGIGFARGDRPGFRKMPKDELHRVPDSELRPGEGYIYVVGGALEVELAR